MAKHNLQNLSLDDLVGSSWEFTDNSLGGWGVVQQHQALGAGLSGEAPTPSELKVGVLLSTIKLMQAGVLETAWLPTPSPAQNVRVSHVSRLCLARRIAMVLKKL